MYILCAMNHDGDNMVHRECIHDDLLKIKNFYDV